MKPYLFVLTSLLFSSFVYSQQMDETKKEIINESADLIYHWLLLLKLSNVNPNEVFQELKKRRK